MILQHPLQAQRVVLRTLTCSDIGGRYLSWMKDEIVQQYLESRFHDHNEASLRAYVRTCNDRPDVVLLGIEDLVGGLHIGNIKLGPINGHHQTASIGIMIGDKSRWGKGYASEAIGRLVEHATNELQVRKFTAGCYAQNKGSIHAFERAGFVQEAVLSGHAIIKGMRTDVVFLARHV